MKQLTPHYTNKQLTLASLVGLGYFIIPSAVFIVLVINLSIFFIQYINTILILSFVVESLLFIQATNRFIETLLNYNKNQTPLTKIQTIRTLYGVGIMLIFGVVIGIFLTYLSI